MKGVLLLSIGHPSYARWAHNMAVSLRAMSPGLCIHVLTDGNFPAEPIHGEIVDKIIKIAETDCRKDGKLYPALAKLSMNKYSEFEETIYLDVDGVVVKDITPLFDKCKEKGLYFQVQVNGISTKEFDNLDASLWVKPEQIFKKYKLNDDVQIPGTNSSFQYWVKCKESDKLFAQALKNLSKPFELRELRYSWGMSNTQPDELYMNIALAQVGLIPNIEPVLYIRKRNTGGRMSGLDEIAKDRYVICCFGGVQYNHAEISGTGDSRTGLYNKHLINCYKTVYGESVKFVDSFYRLINDKVYNKPVK